MLDYRKLSGADLNSTIISFGRTTALSDDVLDGLLCAAVWHSIKDQQTTPAVNLLGACSRNTKDRVSQYLTKFGNVQYSDKKGLHHSKAKAAIQSGLMKADEVFDTLPTLAEAFPSKPKQYKDMVLMARFKALIAQAEEIKKHGHSIIATDEEKKVYEEICNLVTCAS